VRLVWLWCWCGSAQDIGIAIFDILYTASTLLFLFTEWHYSLVSLPVLLWSKSAHLSLCGCLKHTHYYEEKEGLGYRVSKRQPSSLLAISLWIFVLCFREPEYRLRADIGTGTTYA